MDICIRREKQNDYENVEKIIREAFWNLNVPGCDEHYLSHILRKHKDFIFELDFVAEVNGKVVGSIMYTRSFIVDEKGNKIKTLTFGPLCVLPRFQRMGIGSKLINYTKNIAIKNNEKAIIILGHPHNYCKYGFKNSKDYSISNTDGKYPYGQLVLELKKGIFNNKKWKFHYSNVYNLNEKEAKKFDKKFPKKVKKYQPTQEEFSIAVRAFL